MTTWWVRYCTYRFLETHLIRNTIILPMQYIISCVYVSTDQHIMVQNLLSISRVRYLSLLIYSGHFHRRQNTRSRRGYTAAGIEGDTETDYYNNIRSGDRVEMKRRGWCQGADGTDGEWRDGWEGYEVVYRL
jgi:hypothetical protein